MKTSFFTAPDTPKYCLLLTLSIFCFIFTLIRHIITGNTAYYFLLNNLLLAAIPLIISFIISLKFIINKPKIITIILFIIWLLFLPNSFYIITDLYYLMDHPERMFWYDLIMILTFAWTGLLYGFFSLDKINDILFTKLTNLKIKIITCFILFSSAFGVYLGRDLRWNSWDIFIEPKEFFLDFIDRFINPLGHYRTWGFTLLMWIFLNITYWSYRIINKKTIF